MKNLSLMEEDKKKKYLDGLKKRNTD